MALPDFYDIQPGTGIHFSIYRTYVLLLFVEEGRYKSVFGEFPSREHFMADDIQCRRYKNGGGARSIAKGF